MARLLIDPWAMLAIETTTFHRNTSDPRDLERADRDRSAGGPAIPADRSSPAAAFSIACEVPQVVAVVRPGTPLESVCQDALARGIRVRTMPRLQAALDVVAENAPDLFLIDMETLGLADSSALSALQDVHDEFGSAVLACLSARCVFLFEPGWGSSAARSLNPEIVNDLLGRDRKLEALCRGLTFRRSTRARRNPCTRPSSTATTKASRTAP